MVTPPFQPPLTVELPDEDIAEALRQRLHAFDVDTVERDAHWELRIQRLERSPESRVTKALHEIDAWLTDAGVDAVRVHLDGDSYTLHARSHPDETPAEEGAGLERDSIARLLGEEWQAEEPGIYRYVGPDADHRPR